MAFLGYEHLSFQDVVNLLGTVRELSSHRDARTIRGLVRRLARALIGADDAAFIGRDGENLEAGESDGMGEPVWSRPLSARISARSMLHREPVAIEDVMLDDRVQQHPARNGNGAGLGLWIAKGLVEIHGGRIGAENHDGGGAAFWFTLPRTPRCDGSGAQSQRFVPATLSVASATDEGKADDE